MDLAKTLVRTVARGFYTTEYILIIDALAIHSTLTDADLAHVLGMQTKATRRVAGKLKEDGLISVQSRGEKKEGAPPAFGSGHGNGPPKERLFYRDWYFINFHRAIDSIKYRMWKLNRYIESQGAPTAERKDLICPRCKSTYTELEVMDNIGDEGFYCHRCSHLLDPADDAEGGPAENENMKRMNDQLVKMLGLMRQIDSVQVPENDFDEALRYYLPIDRPDSHPGARTTVVDDRNKPHIASAKGLQLAPEKISVNLTEDKVDEILTEQGRAERKAKEAKQNSLPEWISRSTLTGEVTTVGAREIAERRKRDVDLGGPDITDDPNAEESKRDVVDNAVMDEYWRELEVAQERERREEQAEDEDEDDDDDDEDQFEDVGGLPRLRTDEPSIKRQRIDAAVVDGNGTEKDGVKVSDVDDDDDEDDELEFEDV